MKKTVLVLVLLLLGRCITSEKKYILTPNDHELVNAVKMSNIPKIKQLLRKGANVNARLESDISILMLAAGGAYSKVIREKSGMAYMTMQKISRNYEIAKLLIENKVDVNFINETGRTALIQAAIMGNLDIVKLLVNSGADAGIRDKSKTRAIDYASRLGHKDVVKFLSGIN